MGDGTNGDDSARGIERRRFMKTVSAASIGGTTSAGFASARDLRAQKGDLGLGVREKGDYRSHLTFRPVILDEEKLSTDRQKFVNEVIAKGTVSTYGHVPIPAGPVATVQGDRYVESGGDYYRLSIRETGQVEVEKYTLHAELTNEDIANSSVVDISSLPRREQRAVKRVVRLARETSHRDLSTEYRTVVFASNPPIESLTAPDRTYVTSEDDTFRLVFEQKEVLLVHYLNEAELVGADVIESEVASEFAGTDFRTADWSEGERAVFTEARDEGSYAEWAPYSSAYKSLLVRFGSPLAATHHSTVHSATIDGRYYRVKVDIAHVDMLSG